MESRQGDAALEARLRDAVRLSASGGRARFFGFLDEREAGVVKRLAERNRFSNVLLWGGYPGAERVMSGAFPDFLAPELAPEAETFPVSAVTAAFRACDRLSHRDFLGALLGAGIERPALGDLLVEEGRCVFFCRSGIVPFLLSNVEKIGNVGVRLRPGFDEPLPPARRYGEWSAVVASARLDCTVAAAGGGSRGEAAELIRSGLVQLNHETVVSPDAAVREGDKLSVRGKGRFVLDRLGPVTKKGRLSIKGRKYL